LSPRVRVEPREVGAIQAIPPSVIEPFLSKPLVIGERELDTAPEIVATQEDRVALGAGNIAYVRGAGLDAGTRWQLFRRGDRLIDPESGQLLGYVGLYLGEADVVRAGEVSTIAITKVALEVYRGDKLVPLPPDKPVFGYVPHAPQTPVRGRVVLTYGGLWETGPLNIIALSKGTRDGLEVGHVLALYRDLRSARYAERTEPLYGRIGPTGNDARLPYVPADLDARSRGSYATDPAVRDRDFARLPAERYGLVMIFRTFERASYALVMQADRPVAVSDIISNP
jgi:hypothetical protein